MSENPVNIRTLVGKVTSASRLATRTVEVYWSRRHAQYGKVVKGKSRFHVHDPKNEALLGDIVRIKEGRPVSKTKSWYLVEIVERAEQAVEEV